jgi:hypothetical protein
MRSWIAALLFVVACRGQSKPSKESAGSAAGSGSAVAAGSGSAAGSADPWTQPETKPATPEEKKKRAEAAIARVTSVQPKLAALRGLPLAKPVPAQWQSTEDFRKFVLAELAKELPKEKADKLAAAELHVGLFMKPIDLAKVLEQTMVSQAAAYYDPATQKFFVVMAPDNDMMLDTISAHELTHALQDANFDLKKYLPPTLDDDAGIARKFVVEGDATFAMIAYLAAEASGGKGLSPAMMGLMKTQISNMASMSIEDYGSMMKQQSASMVGMDADLKKSMESIGELPPIVIKPLIDSYMKGAVVSMVAYEKGGWKGVDDLYKHPPTSSEQVLHPAEKLIGKREEPKTVTLPALPKGEELVKNVWGELQWQIYFEQWGIKQPEASAGWGGDRYAVIKKEDGTLIGVIATTWDTPKDAMEFRDAYVASLTARFNEPDVSKPEAGVARKDHGKVFVKLVGNSVFIVDGGDDAKLLDQLAKGTKIK